MKSLEQVKAAFGSKSEKRESLPNNYFPFWNMKEGEQAIVRFLPDANEENELGFLVEKVMHTLEINGERKSVPCLSMYDEDCPICAVSQQYYKADDKDNGKKYWKKKQYIAQALVIDDPLPEDDNGETHEGKVRYLALGWQLFNIIKAAFEDGELDDIPYAFEGGTNFIIKKTKQGDYATYALGSKFARKSTDLDEDTLANINLIDLKTLLPKQPDRNTVESMLEAALTGGDYNDGGNSAPKEESVKEKVTAAVTESVSVQEDDSDIDDEAEDILAQIRNRKKNKAE